MSFARQLIRHWVGLLHGMLLMLAIAWQYEGKMNVYESPRPLVWLIAIPTFVLVAFSIGEIVKSYEK